MDRIFVVRRFPTAGAANGDDIARFSSLREAVEYRQEKARQHERDEEPRPYFGIEIRYDGKGYDTRRETE